MLEENRIEKLKAIQEYILSHLKNNLSANIVFICVQNSRRSHLSQVIAQHTAHQFQLHDVHCYSGGVEVTQIHPNTIKCLKSLGYSINLIKEGENPVYSCSLDDKADPILLYSKNFEEVTKTLSHFAAVMVCSESESNCPYVPNAERKILLPYEDPKWADSTNNPIDAYLKIALQIQDEMKWLFSNIASQINSVNN